jgi:hypothetical protein
MSAEHQAEPPPSEPQRIEAARSARSSCKTCRRKIAKGALRLGVEVEGPFGRGYLWHHLACAARARPDDLAEAYARRAWPPDLEVPPLEELQAEAEARERARAERPRLPYAELDPSGRAACKQCGDKLQQGQPRVALARAVVFGKQIRTSAVLVHPRCVPAALQHPDNATAAGELAGLLQANSGDLPARELERVLREAGLQGQPPA